MQTAYDNETIHVILTHFSFYKEVTPE